MDEFSLINTFFKSISHYRDDVIFGIGDDAACLQVPAGMQLLVSTDTLVENIHFLSSWNAYDIAYRSLMINISDIASMGAQPCWVSLALTLPAMNTQWLQNFSQGLKDGLNEYNIALIGGDTTCGPLTITLTIHGLIPTGKAIRRSGAVVGDKIYVTGQLGAAAFAVSHLLQPQQLMPAITEADTRTLLKALLHPTPRVDLSAYLQSFATAAIDISDGISADLNHICVASGVGACIDLNKIPVHSLLRSDGIENALDFALHGGDDYELCFTVNPQNEEQLLSNLANERSACYCIGIIEDTLGLRAKTVSGDVIFIEPQGYNHFKDKRV